jgi:hypothetical protein
MTVGSKMEFHCKNNGGSDGTRTRGLRRDRPDCSLKSKSFQGVMTRHRFQNGSQRRQKCHRASHRRPPRWYPVECERGFDCCPICDGPRRDPGTLKVAGGAL